MNQELQTEETPVEETPVEETPVEETPVEETPTEVEEINEEINEEKVVVYSNNSVYADDNKCDDNELRAVMLKDTIDLTNDNDNELYNYCDTNIEQRFRNTVKRNNILPMELMTKRIKLKLKKKNDKCREKIRTTINETFKNFYPDKILTFINNTTELLFIERIKNMDRCYTCLYNGTYYNIQMKTYFVKKFFGTSSNMVEINISTVKYE